MVVQWDISLLLCEAFIPNNMLSVKCCSRQMSCMNIHFLLRPRGESWSSAPHMDPYKVDDDDEDDDEEEDYELFPNWFPDAEAESVGIWSLW